MLTEKSKRLLLQLLRSIEYFGHIYSLKDVELGILPSLEVQSRAWRRLLLGCQRVRHTELIFLIILIRGPKL